MQKDFEAQSDYIEDFSLNALFPIKSDEEITEDKLGLMINEHSSYPLYIYLSMNNDELRD